MTRKRALVFAASLLVSDPTHFGRGPKRDDLEALLEHLVGSGFETALLRFCLAAKVPEAWLKDVFAGMEAPGAALPTLEDLRGLFVWVAGSGHEPVLLHICANASALEPALKGLVDELASEIRSPALDLNARERDDYLVRLLKKASKFLDGVER